MNPPSRFLRLLAPVLLCALAACSTLRTHYVRQETHAIPPRFDTAAARYVQGEVASHPGQSGFGLLISNQNALMSRIVMIDHARHSIDLQYYIFFGDATGRLVAQRLLAAADRGVRVRLLLDDIDIVKEDDLLDALDAHANIEVRLFNPFRFRQRSMLSKAGQFLLEGPRLNRRMHNKTFTVDGMESIIGGRNIGDAYFDADEEFNFRDLDAIAIGPVVEGIAASFDEYWNSDAAFPVRAYSGPDATTYNLAQERVRLTRDARAFSETDYAQALLQDLPEGPSAAQRGPWLWGDAAVVADDPSKVDPAQDGARSHIVRQIGRTLDGAREQALLISPYFIPGDDGEALLEAMAARGVRIKVLTNSLAANDEPAVHAGYVGYRLPMLRAGVDLYEFRPINGEEAESAHGTSSGVSLHAKAMVVDHRHVFIGSMNFDPRSRYLNTEMGVIVDSPDLARAVEAFFEHASSPANAFHVVLAPRPGDAGGKPVVQWIAEDDGIEHRWYHEPEVSAGKRLKVQLLRMLPIEGLL